MSFLSDDELAASLCETTEPEEMLPFAMHEGGFRTDLPLKSSNQLFNFQSASPMTVPLAESVFHPDQSASSQPPALASSLMSGRSDDSTQVSSAIYELASSAHWSGGHSSLFDGDLLSSRHLDAAAIIAGSHLSQMSTSFQLHNSEKISNHVNPTEPATIPGSYSSLEFSRLMQNADDTHRQSCVQNYGQALPVFVEEPDSALPGQSESFHSAQGERSSTFLSNITSTSSQIAILDWMQVDHGTERFSSAHYSFPSDETGYRPPQLDSEPPTRRPRGLDHSVLRRTGVEMRQLDPLSFEVSIDIAPGCSVVDVMEVIANPTFLTLWCESIKSVVITNSSEGVRDATSRDGTNSSRRQYDGEWIEATTIDLVPPPSTSSCFHSTSKAMWSFVGFPSNYGTISMFTERQKGKAGLSMGPFPGDVTVSHSFFVSNMKIINTVTLSRGASSAELLCGVLECFESILLPTIRGYMDQVVSSMLSLRLLVETAEREHSSVID